MFKFLDVAIRPIEIEDLPKMVELRSNPSIWMNLGDIHMIGLRDQQRWFDGLYNESGRKYFIYCTDKNEFLGIVRMDEFDLINRSVRIGGDIIPDCQGKGYGKKMYLLLLKYCFDFLNMNRVWLLVLETNIIAINLYIKMGFQEEGRMRKAIFRDGFYHDYIMMSIISDQREKQK